MGGAQSSPNKTRQAKRKNMNQDKKRQPIKSHDRSNQPIKAQSHSDKPIKTQNGANGKKRYKNRPITTDVSENPPIRNKQISKESIITVDKATNTDRKTDKTPKKSKHKEKKPKTTKTKKNEKIEKKEKVNHPMEDATGKQKQPKERMSPKKQKAQIEKEKKMQRVTKEQLRNLSQQLKRTAWYLGKRLGMTEAHIQKINVNFATQDEQKYQILLWWRRVRGWKATAQNLVILLELGNYTTEEYESILTSSNGDVTIYDKAPEIMTEQNENRNREPYHHDPKKQSKGRSFENLDYNSTMEVHTYERKSRNDANQRREKERERKSRKKKEDRQYQTLPSWWKKPGENTLEKKTRSTEVVYDNVPDEVEKTEEKQKPQADTHDGRSGSSHTDDSGIVTSPPVSPKEIEQQEQSQNNNNNNHFEVTIDVSDITVEGDITIGRNSKRASKTLVVRRCSDSAVKLRYKKYTERKLQVTKPDVTPIKEYESADELAQIFPENNDQHSDVINNNESKKQSNSDITHSQNPPTKSNDEVTNSSVDITNSNNDLTKEGYQSNIRNMIQKYETLTRLRQARSKESVSSNRSSRKSDVPAKTLPRNFTSTATQRKPTKHTSKESLNRYGSHNSVNSRASSGSKKSITKYSSHDAIHKTGRQSATKDGSHDSINKVGKHSATKPGSHDSRNKTGKKSSSRSSSRNSANNKENWQATRHGSYDAINERLVGQSEENLATYVSKYQQFSFGGKGKFPSRFKGLISGIAIFGNGDIVASDGENKRIQIFNKRGKFLTTFDTNTELKPKGICITPENFIAVCCGDAVNVYDREGRIQLSFGQGVFRNNSYCVCCDTNSNYYVTDIVSHTVSVHDNKGRIRKRFGFQGSSMAHFNQPVALTISKANKLYITDSQNHCIKVYSLAGRPLFRIGAKGSADGLFWNPLGICLDQNDHLYVADCGNNRISEFDENCNFLRNILTEADGLWMPSLVQMNKRGQLIICEWEKQFIKVFSIETQV